MGTKTQGDVSKYGRYVLKYLRSFKLRSFTEFLNDFDIPTAQKCQQRMEINARHYQANYLMVHLTFAIIIMIARPIFLVSVLLSLSLGIYLLFGVKDDKTFTLCIKKITKAQLLTGYASISMIIMVFTGGMGLIIGLAIGSTVSVAHCFFHNHEGGTQSPKFRWPWSDIINGVMEASEAIDIENPQQERVQCFNYKNDYVEQFDKAQGMKDQISIQYPSVIIDENFVQNMFAPGTEKPYPPYPPYPNDNPHFLPNDAQYGLVGPCIDMNQITPDMNQITPDMNKIIPDMNQITPDINCLLDGRPALNSHSS